MLLQCLNSCHASGGKERKNPNHFSAANKHTPAEKIVEKLRQQLLKKGTDIFADKPYIHSVQAAGSKAAAFIIEGMRQPIRADGKDIPLAAARLGILLAEADPSSIQAFANALAKKEAPVGLLLDILENHPTQEALNAARLLLSEGLLLYKSASEELIRFLSGSPHTERNELASTLATAESLITAILHPESEAAASRHATLLAELSDSREAIETAETIKMARSVSDMKSKGIMYAKRAVQALAKSEAINDALMLVPLLSHESKEIREAAVRALILRSISKKDDHEELYSLCIQLLSALSGDGEQNCEAILRVLKKGQFSSPLSKMFVEKPETFLQRNFNSNTYSSLTIFLFQSFSGIRNDLFISLSSRSPESAIGIYQLVFQQALSSVPLDEAMKISEKLLQIASNDSFSRKTRKKAIAMLSGMPEPLIDSFRAEADIDPSRPEKEMRFRDLHAFIQTELSRRRQVPAKEYSSAIIIFDPEPSFTNVLKAHAEGIFESIGVKDNIIITLNNSDMLDDIIMKEHIKICCIISRLPTSMEYGYQQRILRILKSLKLSPPLLFVRTEKGQSLNGMLKAFGIERNTINELCHIPIRIYDRLDFLRKESFHTILGECGILSLKDGKPLGETHNLRDYLLLSLVGQKAKELLGETPAEMRSSLLEDGPRIFESCGCLYIRGAAEGRRQTLLLVGPTKQTAEIVVEGAHEIAITHLGSLNPNYPVAAMGRHSARVIHGEETESGWHAKRSDTFSKGEKTTLKPQGRPYRVSISNRTGNGANLMLIEEFFTPPPFPH